jgi:hypothetical protein
MYVTVLNYNTEARQSEGVAKRKTLFEEVLYQANETVASSIKAADNKRLVWNIFVAPEYSFANPLNHDNHGPGDVRHLSEGSKISIEGWLKGLSAKYPKTLIFPGSIAWKKTLDRDLGTYLKNKEAAQDNADRAALTSQFRAKVQTRQQKAVAAINTNANQFQGGDLNSAVASNLEEFADYYRDKRGWWMYETTHPSGKRRYGKRWTDDPNLARKKLKHAAPTNQQKLNELGGGNVTHMARNTSLIYLAGKKVAKYHKAQDFHEVVDTKGDTVYVPGDRVPTFTVEGLVYGVEICLDHAFGSLQARLAGQVPDVVVLMSAHVTFDPAKLASSSAMVIHACSQQSLSLVGRGGASGVDCTLVSQKPSYSLYSFTVP